MMRKFLIYFSKKNYKLPLTWETAIATITEIQLTNWPMSPSVTISILKICIFIDGVAPSNRMSKGFVEFPIEKRQNSARRQHHERDASSVVRLESETAAGGDEDHEA